MSYVRELRNGGGFLVRSTEIGTPKYEARATEMAEQGVNDIEERNSNSNTRRNGLVISIHSYRREEIREDTRTLSLVVCAGVFDVWYLYG